MARARGRWFLLAPLAVLAAHGTSAHADLRAADVFLPGESVCAVPPRTDAGPAVAARAVPRPEVEPPSAARDLHVLRWVGVEARPLSAAFPIRVEHGTVGLVLRAEGASPFWDVSVELTSPSGELLSCEDCPDAPVASEVRAGRGTAQIPSTDRPGGALAPGTYTFRVRATPSHPDPLDGGGIGDGVTVDVLAAVRTDAAVKVEHVLDLNFVYLPSSTLTADLARTSPRFQSFLDSVAVWLEPAGLRIGDVTHVDLPRPEFDIIHTWDEAGRMFRTSADVGRDRALNVYCVQKFDSPLNPVVGLSGGIPGPLLSGTRDSGIAIRMEPFFQCSDCLGAYASLMAHEIGHYLGFYHTTESDLAHWDPMLDTPECTQDFPYGCGDFPYVMFPLIHAANKVWSPAQTAIGRTHPLVRTIPVLRAVAADSLPRSPAVRVGPNPFVDAVRIALPGGAAADVAIHDVAGRLLRHLRTPGGDLVWDGRSEAGLAAPAGVYFARVHADGEAPVTVRIVKSR